MKLAIISLLLLCAFADQKLDIFEQLKQSDFGRTILGTIQLELQENNYDRVLQFLKQLQVDNSNSQKETESAYSSRQQFVNQQIQFANDVIKKAKERVAEDQALLPLKQEQLTNKLQQQEEKVGEKQRNLDRIAALTTARQASRSEYEERRGELVGLISALKQGKQLLQQVKTGSFIETSIFAEIDNHHKNFIKRFPSHRGYNSLVSLSLAMAQDQALQSDQSLLDRVVQVLDDLADELFQLQKQELESDDAKEAAFQNAKARFETANQALAASVAQLEADVQYLKQKLLELQNDISNWTNLLRNKNAEKQDWQKTLKDENGGFAVTQENLQSQSTLLDQTLSVFAGGPLTQQQQSYIQRIKLK